MNLIVFFQPVFFLSSCRRCYNEAHNTVLYYYLYIFFNLFCASVSSRWMSAYPLPIVQMPSIKMNCFFFLDVPELRRPVSGHNNPLPSFQLIKQNKKKIFIMTAICKINSSKNEGHIAHRLAHKLMAATLKITSRFRNIFKYIRPNQMAVNQQSTSVHWDICRRMLFVFAKKNTVCVEFNVWLRKWLRNGLLTLWINNRPCWFTHITWPIAQLIAIITSVSWTMVIKDANDHFYGSAKF